MNIEDILSEIDAEIARLQQAKALLGNTAPVNAVIKRKPGRPPASAKSVTALVAKKTGKRRTMSPEGRAKIAAAQKARWAKTKKAAKAVAKKKPGRPAKATKKSSAKKTASPKTESSATQA